MGTSLARILVALALFRGAAHGDVREAGMRRALRELGDSDPRRAEEALQAALELESRREVPGLDAPLLLAISWAESRFEPTTGRMFCGVMQVRPRDMELPRWHCRKWRSSVRSGMEAGVREIRKILNEIPRVRGDLHRALEYRACGGKAFTRECRKRGWLKRVAAIADRIRSPAYRIENPHGIH